MAPNPETATEQPHNLDAEENVLGAMMLAPEAIDTASDILTAPDFYRASHAAIFTACVELHNEGGGVDPITVADRLEHGGKLEDAGGRPRLQEIASLMAATSNVGHYAAMVRETAQRRNLIRLGTTITREAWQRSDTTAALIERAEGMIFDVSRGRATTDFVTLGAAVDETVTRIMELHEGGRTIVGVPSGFSVLDALTSGFQPGNLIVVAGRPSMGKSGFAIGLSTNVAFRQEQPVAFFTLEMSRYEITQRVLSSEALVESQKLRNGQMGADEWRRTMDTSARLATTRLFIDDTRTITVSEIRSKARRLKMRHPDLALVVVDYLQLMGRAVTSSERVNEIGQISRSLKILAGELELPVVALSQLSRNLESRHDKRPLLSDLRDSGAIEQDADLVVFIYRDEVYNPEDTDQQGIAELILAKHRNGPTDTVKVSFVKRYARFSELPRPGAGDLR